MSRYRLDRERGGTRRTPSGPAAQRVHDLCATGWTVSQIAVAAGCAERTVGNLRERRYKTIQKDLADRILKAQPTLATVPGTTKISAVGTVRRVQALMAIGHSLLGIADAMGMARTALSNTICGRHPTVEVDTARSAQRVYLDWAGRPGTSRRSINRATARGWAPPAAWDDETIDDPTAAPEWTGCCGTDRGWWMHSLQHIPGCERCDAAHEQWKADHRGLERREFQAALMKSRASASSRGSDIAEDGRELMRLGHSYDTAAERLGVTRNHLQQELIRHPAVDEEMAA
jgi:plasmid maintenance system antidote protein VapI